MSFRVAIMGIDGSGKSTLIHDVATRLSGKYTVTVIGRDTEEDAAAADYSYLRAPSSSEQLREVIQRVNGGSLGIQLQSDLERDIEEDGAADVILSNRDLVVSAAVYSVLYDKAMQGTPIADRLTLARSVSTSRIPDLRIYLDTSPEVASSRLRERDTLRPHETPEGLRTLTEEYVSALPYLRDECEVVVRSTSVPIGDLVDAVSSDIEHRLVTPLPRTDQTLSLDI